MLVLSRRPGERIVIGEDTELAVLEVRGKTVRLGFTAPQSKVIRRAELLWRDLPNDGAPRGTATDATVDNTFLFEEMPPVPIT